jgi:hypothetical protein
MSRAYCLCPARDGLLYVEFPSYVHLRNLLLNQRVRDKAHFRTVDGYVPYYGAGLAFDARYLALAGVKPLWYLRGDASRQIAVEQLIKDGIYRDEDEAYEFDGHHYGDECEWVGPSGMRFDPRWVEQVWVWPGRTPRVELEKHLEELAWLLPGVPADLGKPEPPEGGRRSCRAQRGALDSPRPHGYGRRMTSRH